MDGNKETDRKLSLGSLGEGSLVKSREWKTRRRSEGMKNLDEAHFEILNKNFQSSSFKRTNSIIEEKGASFTDGLFYRSSFRNPNKTFHKHFPEIPETEDLINSFTCALQKEVLYQGKMYVSSQNVCFYSSVLLKETKVQLHISTIQSIKKKNTARVVPNAISIITNSGDEYLFVSLRNRDACFDILNSICPQDANVSSAENNHELEADTTSSQEDNPDSHRSSVSEQDGKTGSNGLLSSSVSNISLVKAKNNSTSLNSINNDDHSSDENTAVSWVAMVTAMIRSLLSVEGRTNVNKLVIVFLITALFLLLSSGYIGLRIAALEEELNTLGEMMESGLQRVYKET
ncbi:GRAM domain-containing protein 2B-like isoform X2 [Neoarius graeffei]|uniref:GRAM domain-containing protein 2B-like isoform X2 n=1 Tax=Neoarius graeffei TaxID=443677 RepID=UPI00298BECC1|nr:GRAM domain-containing protein 2B-like isoform X2 [Neoarius graeffei]